MRLQQVEEKTEQAGLKSKRSSWYTLREGKKYEEEEELCNTVYLEV
jgi:hypothetical protein